MANEEIKEVALTTIDNPYDPFDHYDEWEAFDRSHGYNTTNYLARIAMPSRDLGNYEYATEIERAIDEIVKYNPLGIYVKVFKKKS